MSATKISDPTITVAYQETKKVNVHYGALWSADVSIMQLCEKNRFFGQLPCQMQMCCR